MVAELIQKYFPPVHTHPKRAWYEWQQPFDPMLADLHPREHGVVRQISKDEVFSSGLVLDFEDEGFMKARVS